MNIYVKMIIQILGCDVARAGLVYDELCCMGELEQFKREEAGQVHSRSQRDSSTHCEGLIMSKSEIYRIRAQVHNAMTIADVSKIPYTLLIRMEWKKYGYIPVSARFV